MDGSKVKIPELVLELKYTVHGVHTGTYFISF